MHDIIIIGAGPAGLTAGIYSRRANKSVLIIDKGTFGGQMTYSPKIENYPGIPEISGSALADKMVEMALSLGCEVEVDTVTGIKINPDGTKTVKGEYGEYISRAVILATGAAHRKLGVANEEKYIGNGIYFCAVCDGAFFKDRSVALIGGGNSAMQEALLLSENCKKVTVIQNLPTLTGEPRLAELIAERPNIEVIYNSTVEAILEKDENFTGITVNKNGEMTDMYFDGMFVAIGLVPENKPFEDVARLDERGYFDSDESCLTESDGIFVAGDCRRKAIRQVTTATSDGAVASIAAQKYLQ